MLLIVITNLSPLKVMLLNKYSYISCGCGCCGGTLASSKIQCIDKTKGESLKSIKERDLDLRNSGICAVMGCSIGIRYVDCETASIVESIPETPDIIKPLNPLNLLFGFY